MSMMSRLFIKILEKRGTSVALFVMSLFLLFDGFQLIGAFLLVIATLALFFYLVAAENDVDKRK